jgi:hypothetical protein
MRSLLVVLLSIGLITTIAAQDRTLSVLATVGVTTPILDSGLGLHVGLQPSIPLTDRLSAEGQVSYRYSRVDATFLSGETGTDFAINTLLGARYYLNGEDKRSRFFINALCGVIYANEDIDSRPTDPTIGVGFSTGLFVCRRKLTLGLSFESQQHLVLKGGYSF